MTITFPHRDVDAAPGPGRQPAPDVPAGSRHVIACSALNATVESPSLGQPLLDGVSVNIQRGSFTAITGRPRSGARELGHALAGQRGLDGGLVVRAVDRVAFVPAQLDAARLSDAVARALADDPELVVVDTFGWATSDAVLSSLRTVARERDMTVVLVTSDFASALIADRVLVMDAGHLAEDL